jgi:hypothetical protein
VQPLTPRLTLRAQRRLHPQRLHRRLRAEWAVASGAGDADIAVALEPPVSHRATRSQRALEIQRPGGAVELRLYAEGAADFEHFFEAPRA